MLGPKICDLVYIVPEDTVQAVDGEKSLTL